MNAKRILLMYITEVSGHHQATLAIEKSLKILDPHIQTLNINGFGYAYPLLEKLVNKAYMGVIKKTPQVWDYLYDNQKVAKRLHSVKQAVLKANHKKLARLFEQFQPDGVICTQAFPCGMVADYKKAHRLGVKVIGVLTDYAPHSYWIHEGIDYYVVPSKETAEALEKKGVESKQIKAFGIPVDPKFTDKLDKESILRKLNLQSDKPVILIMGGGQGLGPIKDVVSSLLQSTLDMQLIIVAGINKKLIAWLNKLKNKTERKIIIFEYTKNIEELMEVATLIVTKPGGMTTTEALVKGLPMVITKPLPGQEMHNTHYLLSKNVAVRINRFEKIGEELESLLKVPGRIEAMRTAAFENGRPQSSFEIAKLALS